MIVSLDDHHCKAKLLAFISNSTNPTKHVTGLHRTTDLILELIGPEAKFEDPTQHQLTLMDPSEIEQSKKEDESLKHMEWAD